MMAFILGVFVGEIFMALTITLSAVYGRTEDDNSRDL